VDIGRPMPYDSIRATILAGPTHACH